VGFDHDDEDGRGAGCRESQISRETLNPSLTGNDYRTLRGFCKVVPRKLYWRPYMMCFPSAGLSETVVGLHRMRPARNCSIW
jgi:hypothetical protein